MTIKKIKELDKIPLEDEIAFCPRCEGLVQVNYERCEDCSEKNPYREFPEPDPFEAELAKR